MFRDSRIVCVALLVALVALPLAAEDVTSSTKLNFVAATSMEAKASITHEIKIPVLVGEGGLVSGNNLKLKGTIELSPVSANVVGEAVLTPIAFLEFNAGAQVGSGWNFLDIANGLGVTTRGVDGKNSITKDPFIGAVWKVKAGGAFQFDLAALVPGDWNHVVVRTYHEAFYRALTPAAPDTSWQWEADGGENRDGLNYYANYLLGYQMPIFVDTVGLLLETDLYLFDTAGRSAWGDDLVRFNFGPLANLKISDSMSLALLVQWKTKRNFVSGTADLFYKDRDLDEANPLRIEFNRFAASFTVKL